MCAPISEITNPYLPFASVDTMLARLRLAAQKSLERAYQRDAQTVERWKHRPTQNWQHRPSVRRLTFCFGTSQDFVQMLYVARLGLLRCRHPW